MTSKARSIEILKLETMEQTHPKREIIGCWAMLARHVDIT